MCASSECCIGPIYTSNIFLFRFIVILVEPPNAHSAAPLAYRQWSNNFDQMDTGDITLDSKNLVKQKEIARVNLARKCSFATGVFVFSCQCNFQAAFDLFRIWVGNE